MKKASRKQLSATTGPDTWHLAPGTFSWTALVLLLVLAVTLIAASGPVRLATLAPKGTSFEQVLAKMREDWAKAPDGGVVLRVFPDGTMGTEADMVSRMRVGQLQAAMLMVTGLIEIDPGAAGLQFMPMMFRDLREVEYVREKLQPLLAERMEKKGFVVLFWADAGFARFFSRQPVITPADLKTMKVFALASDNNQIDIMKSMGYRPVPLEFSDVLMAVKRQMVDVVPTAPFAALAGQFYSETPHMLEINWVPVVGATVILKKTWDSFTPAQREFLAKSAAEAGRQIQAKGRAESDANVEEMKKRGLTVHPLSPAVEAEWRKLAESIYPRIRGTMVPADVFDQVQKLLAEYRAAKPGAAGKKAEPARKPN